MKNNVGLLLGKRAQLSPRLEAVIEPGGRRLSFAELDARANRTARALAERGIAQGDRVALLLMNGPEFIESFFGLAKLGAVVVPVNWRLVPDELAFILKDSGSRALLYDGDFVDAVSDLHGRGREGTGVEHWVQVGSQERLPFAEDYDRMQKQASDAAPEITACDDDLLYIMYTSGTTGLPKGAVHTHSSSLWAIFTIAATADVRFRDRYLLALPLFHVGALTPLTGNIYRGNTSVVMRTFDPVQSWELIRDEQITTALAVPAMLNFMLKAYEKMKDEYQIPSRLRWIMSGAAPVPVTLIEAYMKLGVEIHQVYGLTESCGPACLTSPDEALSKVGSTGKPFFHTEVRVVDESGNDVPPGEPGEVIIRGLHIMKEYWNRPEATAEAIRGGWLYTGDVATMDKDGCVYIHDRTKDMIISGGENVYPAEIENAILSHPKVAEVAVIGQPSPKWGESPLAVVVRTEPDLTGEEVIAHCRIRLARYKLPKAVEFVDEIPRNASGKVLKRLLRERFPGPAPE